MENTEQNTLPNFMKSSYGDDKYDKSNELNETMSIMTTNSPDEYGNKIVSLGGNN